MVFILMGKKSVKLAPSKTPEEAVLNFIHDFASWKPLDLDGGVTDDDLDPDHYLPDSIQRHLCRDEPLDSLFWFDIAEQNHHVELERICHTTQIGDQTSTIITTVYSNPENPFEWREYHYHLERVEAGWLTDTIEFFESENPSGPLATWSIQSLGLMDTLSLDDRVPIYFDKIFNPKPGAVLSGDQLLSATVEEVGTISFPSGTVALWEGLGYEREPTQPLTLRVPKTEAKVSLALIDGRIGAIRIAFADSAQVCGYIPANRDTWVRKMVGIGDGHDLAQTTPRVLEEVYNTLLILNDKTKFRFFDLNPNHPRDSCMFIPMEAYPAAPYWGVDLAGKPVCLVVHFNMYHFEHEHQEKVIYRYRVNESGDSIQTPKMKEHGFSIQLIPRDKEFEAILTPEDKENVTLGRVSVQGGREVTPLHSKATVIIEWSYWEDVLASP